MAADLLDLLIALLVKVSLFAILWVAICLVNGWSIDPFVPY